MLPWLLERVATPTPHSTQRTATWSGECIWLVPCKASCTTVCRISQHPPQHSQCAGASQPAEIWPRIGSPGCASARRAPSLPEVSLVGRPGSLLTCSGCGTCALARCALLFYGRLCAKLAHSSTKSCTQPDLATHGGAKTAHSSRDVHIATRRFTAPSGPLAAQCDGFVRHTQTRAVLQAVRKLHVPQSLCVTHPFQGKGGSIRRVDSNPKVAAATAQKFPVQKSCQCSQPALLLRPRDVASLHGTAGVPNAATLALASSSDATLT